MLLILAILGSMYAGIATPSESAAVGVLGALLIAYFQKGLTRQSMRDIAMGSIQTCAMIALILLRSAEHTSELQSLMRNSYADLCLKKKNYHTTHTPYNSNEITPTPPQLLLYL